MSLTTLTVQKNNPCYDDRDKARAEWSMYYFALRYAESRNARLRVLRMEWTNDFLTGKIEMESSHVQVSS
jgi:hypothetical protein